MKGKTPRRSLARARHITATSAAKTFGRLLEHVRSERAEYVVERGGKPAARILPAADRCSGRELVEFFRGLGKPDAAYLDAVESGIAALNKPAIPGNKWEP